jgi:hypothetical protein
MQTEDEDARVDFAARKIPDAVFKVKMHAVLEPLGNETLSEQSFCTRIEIAHRPERPSHATRHHKIDPYIRRA